MALCAQVSHLSSQGPYSGLEAHMESILLIELSSQSPFILFFNISEGKIYYVQEASTLLCLCTRRLQPSFVWAVCPPHWPSPPGSTLGVLFCFPT